MRTIAEVVEDIKNGTWGSDIEYQSECEKLHKLCDEILEIEKAKMERIVAELVQFGLNSMDKQMYDSDTYYDGVSVAIRKACNIVKRGGVE